MEQHESQQPVQNDSPLITAISELTGSLLKLAQERIIERIEIVANNVTKRVIVSLTIVFLGLISFVFILVGLSLWIGTITQFGAWFGLFVTGIALSIITLIIALFAKK